MSHVKLAFMILCALVLISCSSENEETNAEVDNEEVESEEKEQEKEKEKEEKTPLIELTDKMKEAAKEIESYSTVKSLGEDLGLEKGSWESTIMVHDYVTFDPIGYKQDLTVIIPRLTSDVDNVEVVYTEEDGYYIYWKDDEKWEKYPDAAIKHFPRTIKKEFDLNQVISQLATMGEAADFEEKDEQYVVELSYDAEELEKEKGDAVPDSFFDVEQLRELDIDQLTYTFEVDKSS